MLGHHVRRLLLVLLLLSSATAVLEGIVPCEVADVAPDCFVALRPGPTDSKDPEGRPRGRVASLDPTSWDSGDPGTRPQPSETRFEMRHRSLALLSLLSMVALPAAAATVETFATLPASFEDVSVGDPARSGTLYLPLEPTSFLWIGVRGTGFGNRERSLMGTERPWTDEAWIRQTRRNGSTIVGSRKN